MTTFDKKSLLQFLFTSKCFLLDNSLLKFADIEGEEGDTSENMSSY